jgi:hypothetical protein
MSHLAEYNAARELAEEVWPDFQRRKIGMIEIVIMAHKRGYCGGVGVDAMAYLRQWKKEGKA